MKGVGGAIVWLVAGAAPAAGQIGFDELFVVVDTLVLEEREEALNAAPVVRRDGVAGGWLVADRTENQVRTYDADGRLLTYFGREGRGPGEFRRLVGAVRTAAGQIVTVDAYGRVAIWSDGGALRRELRVDVRAVAAIELVADTLVLATAPLMTDPTHASGPVLHFVDLARGEHVASALEPAIQPGEVGAWATVSGAAISRLDDAHAVVTLPLDDTVRVFRSLRDPPIARMAIDHALLDELSDIPDGHADRPAFDAWIRRAHFVFGVAPAGPGAFVVSLSGLQKEPRTLLVRAAGRTDEVVDAPVLLSFDPASAVYVFRDPSTLEPNRFLLARLR